MPLVYLDQGKAANTIQSQVRRFLDAKRKVEAINAVGIGTSQVPRGGLGSANRSDEWMQFSDAPART